MRIVIDYQGVQTGSRFRGIGRYAASLTKAMIRYGNAHEFIVVLNGQFADGIEAIRADLAPYLPQSHIRVWYTPGPLRPLESRDPDLARIAEVMREHYIRSLEPDVIVLTSLFEGLSDAAVLSVKRSVREIPVACIFYDLTPLVLPESDFETNPLHRRWYRDRIADLKQCDLLLAISESSRGEALRELQFAAESVVNIFGAPDERFVCKHLSAAEKRLVGRRFGLTKPFILHAGGLEKSKNLRGLIAALSNLPSSLKEQYQIVCVGKRNEGDYEEYFALSADPAVHDMLVVLDHVSDDALVDLYNACSLFVFPSLREGLGLPALEAMACGAPTITSDCASLPEIVRNNNAMFDPTSPSTIAAKITEVLSDTKLQERLSAAGLERAAALTWQACAEVALAALARFAPGKVIDSSRRTTIMQTGIIGPRALKILVQKLDHHGDFFLGLPAMAKLRARYPSARIDALVGSWNKGAAEASGLFDTIFTLDFFKSLSSDRPTLSDEQLDIIRQMPYYDYAIDLRRQFDTRFILLKIKADSYFGYETGSAEIDQLLTNGLKDHAESVGVRRYYEETHTCEQVLRIVEALPFDVNDYVALPAMGTLLPTKKGSVAIFPRVGLDARQWNSDRFGLLVQNLAESPEISQINVYAGKAEELATIPLPDHPKVAIKCGLSFSELFTSLSENEICVGNNSFGVHLASYAGCRTTGIYSGHELPQQWGPAFNDAKVIMVDAECAPCHLPDRQSCPFGVFCLDDISVKAVTNLVLADVSGATSLLKKSEIIAQNPASAVPALVNEINRLKTKDQIAGLSPTDRLALNGAIARNFPKRTRRGRTLFIDMSNFRYDVDVLEPKTQIQWDSTQRLITALRAKLPADYSVVTVASRRHDHEFYIMPFEKSDDVLLSPADAPILRPIPGDIFLGIDSNLFRSAPQWDLIYSWRSQGVTTAYLVPDSILTRWHAADGEDREAQLFRAFLQEIMHFDQIIVEGRLGAITESWIRANAPPRDRPLLVDHIACIETGPADGSDRESPTVATAKRLVTILTDPKHSISNRPARAHVAELAE
ncbi:glycosyltransferase [Sphingomonas sp. AAP5]|uniref:glycosyltransferase n=1 Tax=Sphingomonas sp. AAP5 TaxID=1523415 RepID=UPI00105710B7|nr:glycosyltransferase [Sphingomonas sp. AAP5]QBM76829.1 glycosyltransferase [Sphingomonas sp. AAP5]